MRYTPSAVQRAFEELKRRRETAVSLQNEHIETVKNNLPEVYSIYRSIKSTATRLAQAVFSGDKDSKELVEGIKRDNLYSQKRLSEMLLALGYPENYLSCNYYCKSCCDTGVSMGNRCSCLTELMRKYTIEELNSQCKIKLRSFSEFRTDYYPESLRSGGREIRCRELMEKNLSYCIEYCKSFTTESSGIFMHGATGLGKTLLSSCIASELLKKGYSVAFDSVQNYLRAVEREHFGRSEGDTMETLLSADLLILDDLGAEFESSFNTATVYNLINSRCSMGKPTIVSTNMPINRLMERYDDRIVSRLIGELKTLRFIGEDIRQLRMERAAME